eukprot:m.565572 g.565572  ORF g.565572 m.565572 type:complete len:385 (+) comp22245_c0_seq4:2222-3376(+)
MHKDAQESCPCGLRTRVHVVSRMHGCMRLRLRWRFISPTCSRYHVWWLETRTTRTPGSMAPVPRWVPSPALEQRPVDRIMLVHLLVHGLDDLAGGFQSLLLLFLPILIRLLLDANARLHQSRHAPLAAPVVEEGVGGLFIADVHAPRVDRPEAVCAQERAFVRGPVVFVIRAVSLGSSACRRVVARTISTTGPLVAARGVGGAGQSARVLPERVTLEILGEIKLVHRRVHCTQRPQERVRIWATLGTAHQQLRLLADFAVNAQRFCGVEREVPVVNPHGVPPRHLCRCRRCCCCLGNRIPYCCCLCAVGGVVARSRTGRYAHTRSVAHAGSGGDLAVLLLKVSRDQPELYNGRCFRLGHEVHEAHLKRFIVQHIFQPHSVCRQH